MIYSQIEDILNGFPTKNFKRGEVIYSEGEAPESVYFINFGLVGLFYIAQSGKETFLRIFDDKSIFGHRSYFAEENYHGSSIALKETQIIIVPKKECDAICEQHPQLLKLLLKQVSKDLASAELRISQLQDKSSEQRIAESLWFLKLRSPNQTWTRKEVGEYSGSSHESVARFLTKAENLGILKKEGRDIEILDEDRLLNFENVKK